MIHIKTPIPPLPAFLLGIVFGVACIYLPFSIKSKQAFDTQRNLHGQSLAAMVARDAVEPLFKNDHLSLRAIVETALSDPAVFATSIYDVENNLIMQAGKQIQRPLRFNAPISIQGSIAGYATIDYYSRPWLDHKLQLFVIALMILLTGLAIFYLYRHKSITWTGLPHFIQDYQARYKQVMYKQGTVKTSAAIDTISGGPSDNEKGVEERATESVEAPTVTNLAYTALCIKNLASLQQQLDGPTFRHIFADIENVIEHIMHLYHGTSWDWHHDRYMITFCCEGDDQQSLFHAACAAHLMLDLCAISHGVPMDLSSQVSLDRKAVLDINMPFVGLAIDETAAQSENLQHKISLISLGEDTPSRLLIRAFQAPYCDLLAKQTEQLRDRDV